MTALTGTLRLTRLALRRDRFVLPVWCAVVAGLVAAMTWSMQDMYPTAADRARYAAVAEQSTVQRLFNGPGHGLATVGGEVVFEVGGYLLVLVALLCALATARHSRAQEASGNTELVRAARVGRLAPDAAAGLTALLSALGYGTAAALTLGLGGLGWAGALAYGAGLAAAGTTFAALASVACQLTARPRTATLVTAACLVAAYLLRGFGDVQRSGLVWASPFGWSQAMHPFTGNSWWPLLPSAGFAVLAALGAVVLLQHRDLGAGLLAARAGRERRGPRLSGPMRLLARLTATAVTGWMVVVFTLGLGFGAVTEEIVATAVLGTGTDARDEMIRVAALVLAALAGAAGAALATVVAAEERTGRLDTALAAGLGRGRWASCATGTVLGGSALVLGAGALGLTGGLRLTGVDVPSSEVLATVGLHLPAVGVIAGLALLLALARPGLSALGWGPVAVVLVLGMLGFVLQLPQWALDVSPHTHVPAPDGLGDGAAGLAVLVAVAVLLPLLAWPGFARRDVRV